MYDINALRENEFPLTASNLYFNTASISPIPKRTLKKVQWSANLLAEQPILHFQNDGVPMFEAFGEKFRKYINAEYTSEIVPITSTGSGLNAVAQSLDIKAGQNILFCDMEFPTNAYPWMSLERDGIEIRMVPHIDGGLELEQLAPLVDENTKLVAASAVQFFTGHRTDLKAIGEFCHEHNILFAVDAIQALGHRAFDVQALHIDILVSGGQKSMMAPPGVGMMYVRESVANAMTPRMIGCNSTQDWIFWLDYDLTPLAGASRFAAGTPNVPGMFAMVESLSLIDELGVEHIDQHTTALAATTIDMLEQFNFPIVTPRQSHGSIVTFCFDEDNGKTDAFSEHLSINQVSVAKHLSPQGVPHVRIAFHCYNEEIEITKLEGIIKDYVS